MVGGILENAVDVPSKRRTDTSRKPESVESARTRFAKLLRARIADAQRELEALRAELANLGGSGSPVARRTQACSACGKAGHTKRTCPEREKKNADTSE